MFGSNPTIVPVVDQSPLVTLISVAPLTTWAEVNTSPGATIVPVP